MSVVAMIATMGTGTVTETPFRCLMHNDSRKATFPVDSPIEEGDEIVLVLPGGVPQQQQQPLSAVLLGLEW